MMAARLALSVLAPFALSLSMANAGIAPSLVALNAAALLFFIAVGWLISAPQVGIP